jgi:hypothetical protein
VHDANISLQATEGDAAPPTTSIAALALTFSEQGACFLFSSASNLYEHFIDACDVENSERAPTQAFEDGLPELRALWPDPHVPQPSLLLVSAAPSISKGEYGPPTTDSEADFYHTFWTLQLPFSSPSLFADYHIPCVQTEYRQGVACDQGSYRERKGVWAPSL